MRENWAFLILIGVAAAITAVFLLPYLRDMGHTWIAVVLFGILGVLFCYGRCNPVPRRRRVRGREV